MDDLSVEIGVKLVVVDPFAVAYVELNDLPKKIGSQTMFERNAMKALTPPDLGIFTTVRVEPKVRCISTFSFSCPTTRMMLTVV